jgi:hypothetical protein
MCLKEVSRSHLILQFSLSVQIAGIYQKKKRKLENNNLSPLPSLSIEKQEATSRLSWGRLVAEIEAPKGGICTRDWGFWMSHGKLQSECFSTCSVEYRLFCTSVALWRTSSLFYGSLLALNGLLRACFGFSTR